MSNSEIVVVYVTTPPDKAAALAQILVTQRAAACVNIVPNIRSIYFWQDKVQDDGEALLIIKTTAEKFEILRSLVVENHPYEVPEIIALNVSAGHPPYLDWVEKSVNEG